MASPPSRAMTARANSFGWRRRGARSILHSAEVLRQSPSPTPPSQRGSPMPTPAEKRATFRKLHAQGCFVIPNPWDVGSARYLQGLGFKALATTSSGFAFTQGLPDGGVPRATMLAHFREIAAATDVPVNADFEG